MGDSLNRRPSPTEAIRGIRKQIKLRENLLFCNNRGWKPLKGGGGIVVVVVMSTLKLTTMAVSVYAHKPSQLCHSHHHPHHALNNLVRSISSPPSWGRSSIGRAGNISSLAFCGNREKISALFNDGWWRITTCAYLVHFKPSPKILGFRSRYHYKCFSLGSKRTTSAEKRGFSASRSESSGSDLVEDMGSEGKDHRGWYQDDSHAQNQLPSPQPRPKNPPKLLTLPTILTLARVAAVPLLVCTFYVDRRWGTTATTSIFIAAAITDWLDGYLARKMGLGTAFGAFLDPVADKLMVAATLVLLCTRPLEVAMFTHMPWLLTIPAIVIIGREITMSAVREWAASQNSKLLEAVAVNNLGKWKTATQMVALTILLATRDGSLGGPESVVAFGVTLLYISAGLALWSLVVYMCKIWKFLLR